MGQIVQIVDLVAEANPTRTFENLGRRIIKLGEEFGEVSEAYLNVTSASNGKGLTWDDVREEFADVAIVALDVALTVFEGERARANDIKADLIDLVKAECGPTKVVTEPRETMMLRLMSSIGRLAFLAEVGGHSSKVREQAQSTVVVAIQCARQMLPDQPNLPQATIDTNLHTEVVRKLAKWKRNRDTGTVATDAE